MLTSALSSASLLPSPQLCRDAAQQPRGDRATEEGRILNTVSGAVLREVVGHW